jgi:MarR family transcriptional regulator, transcriptional regulator for hemolysin
MASDVSPGYMTNLAARLFTRAIDDAVRDLGVSTGYLPVFFALCGGRAMTQTGLAKSVAIEQPTMAATLARMERDGLVQRRPDTNDRRSSQVTLTPAAEKKVKAVEKAVAKVNAAALARLGERERAAFLAALGKIIDTLQSGDDQSAGR